MREYLPAVLNVLRAHGAVQVLADMTESDWLHEVYGHGDDGENANDEDDD